MKKSCHPLVTRRIIFLKYFKRRNDALDEVFSLLYKGEFLFFGFRTGMAFYCFIGLITRRSEVQILSPQPIAEFLLYPGKEGGDWVRDGQTVWRDSGISVEKNFPTVIDFPSDREWPWTLPLSRLSILDRLDFVESKESRTGRISGLSWNRRVSGNASGGGIEEIQRLVAGRGFEPLTFGLWARRATELLHPAPKL